METFNKCSCQIYLKRSMQIFFVVLVMSLSIVVADYSSDVIICNGTVFYGVYYDKELLFKGLGRPYNLLMHKFSGVLFFSHTIQNGTQVDFGLMACYVKKGKRSCRDIPGVPGGYAVAYDAGNDDIYFGGHEGIYKYNFLTKSAEFFAEEGKSIWGIFVRNNFYYIEYPTQKLHVYQDDTFFKVPEAVDIEIDNFYISKNIDIYFSNKSALFKVDKSEKQPYVLNDEITVRQIAEDMYGDIYFCASDGIYIEDKPYHKVKKITSIDQAFGMTFDEKDQVIYSDQDAIYRLLPSKHSQTCLYAILNANERKEERKLSESLIS